MPVIAQNVILAAGASSTNVFDNTNYQFINEGTELRVSLATIAANDGASGSNVNYRFTINNTEFADNARNRPLLTITNNTSGSITAKFFVFISQQA